jgi:hypothetical protein
MNPSFQPPAEPPSSVFLLAELPYHELLRKRDAPKAMKLEARMQQILGEAVYLHDGRVIDSIGPRMIAIMPDSHQAVDAALKGRLDLLNHNRGQPASGEIVEAALVVHAGPPVSDGSAFSSPTVAAGLQLLRSMQPGQLLISEKVLREAGAMVPPSAAGEAGGARFFEPPLEEPKPAPPKPPKDVPIAASVPAPTPVGRKKLPLRLIAVAGGAVALIVVALVLLRRPDQVPQTGAPADPLREAAAQPPPPKQRVMIQPVTRPSDAAGAAHVARIEQIVAELMRRNSRIEVADAADATPLTIAVTPGKPVTVAPAVGSQSGTAVPVEPAGAAAAHILGFFADALSIPRHELTSSDAAIMSRLAEAVAAYRQSDRRGRPRALALLQKVIDADPTFLAALRLGIDWFAEGGERSRAVQAAERLLVHEPGDLVVRSKAAFWQIEEGKPVQALPHLAALLRADGSNREALLAVGRIALSAGDDAKFRGAVARLRRLDGASVLHEPDLLAAKGQIDAAVKAYYELERADPMNAALALKIGRIAVLRHSLPIAELELDKLRKLDRRYGYPLLQAYVSAENKFVGDALKSLQQAQEAATWKDDPFTSSAEIFAILNDRRVLESLKAAESRGEATASYILTNPLFRYLGTESEYAALKARLEQHRGQLRAGLADISL